VSKAWNYAWGGQEPNYTRLTDGTHSYNYELAGHYDFSNLFGLLGSKSYYKPKNNYKNYYIEVSYLNTIINLIAGFTSQVEIQEVDNSTKKVVENSEYVKLLNNPNKWQGKSEFIKELTINMLTQGAVVQYGNYFYNGNLKRNSSLYNLDGFNLQYPAIKNPYDFTSRDILDLEFIETLEGKRRKLKMRDINIVYDTINNSFYGGKGYASKNYLCPVSRIESVLYPLQILLNTQDSMAFLSDSPVLGVLSREHNGMQNPGASLDENQKKQIEAKLSGKAEYGTKAGGSGAIIATNESLKYLDMMPDNKKLQMVEMNNFGKEEIRGLFHVPKDIADDTSGKTRGSTYENQQFAEARFIEVVPKGITDKWLASLMCKNKEYFDSRNTKLVGSYNHMPSVIKLKEVEASKGLKDKMDALNTLLDANVKYESNFNIENWMKENGLENLL